MLATTRPGPPRTGTWRDCDVCATPFYVRPSDDRKAALRGHRPKRFCSRACQVSTYKGDGNPKWRGGRTVAASGYVYVYAPDHPNATHHGYVMEHRLVMESHLGRFLDKAEQVHHINHLRDDNRVENLQVMANVVEHRLLHAHYERTVCHVCGKPVERSIGWRRKNKLAMCSRQCGAGHASLVAAGRATCCG